MSTGLVVVDYGLGNLASIQKKLLRCGSNCKLTSDPETVALADKIVLPGVGHFKKAMENLKASNLVEALQQAVVQRGVPILGICLGMQLMTRRSEEGDVDGLGWFDTEVVRFRVQDSFRFKVPHVGWNQMRTVRTSRLLLDIPQGSEFYFVHSFHAAAGTSPDVLCETEYDYRFPSGLEKDNLFALQFHPEKSHDVGEAVLQNFVRL